MSITSQNEWNHRELDLLLVSCFLKCCLEKENETQRNKNKSCARTPEVANVLIISIVGRNIWSDCLISLCISTADTCGANSEWGRADWPSTKHGVQSHNPGCPPWSH